MSLVYNVGPNIILQWQWKGISTGILALFIFYVWFDDGKFRNKASNIMTVIHNHLMFRWIKITRNSTFLLKEKIVLCFRSCVFLQDIWLWEDMTESRGHPDPSMIGSIQDQKVKDSQFWWFAFRGGSYLIGDKSVNYFWKPVPIYHSFNIIFLWESWSSFDGKGHPSRSYSC